MILVVHNMDEIDDYSDKIMKKSRLKKRKKLLQKRREFLREIKSNKQFDDKYAFEVIDDSNKHDEYYSEINSNRCVIC